MGRIRGIYVRKIQALLNAGKIFCLVPTAYKEQAVSGQRKRETVIKNYKDCSSGDYPGSGFFIHIGKFSELAYMTKGPSGQDRTAAKRIHAA